QTPETAVPRDANEARRLGADFRYPVLVKPQTQILFWPHWKGIVANTPEELGERYQAFIRHTAHARALLDYDPDVAHPMLQAYTAAAPQGIYNLSGFVDESFELFAVRASRKLLQRPRKLGVGICFEHAEVDAGLAQKLLGLCRQVRYHGVFEAEFVEDRGRLLLIDFNPRFYGQMAFEIERGVPLAELAYRGALGQRDRVRALMQEALRFPGAHRRRAFCNAVELGMLLRMQGLTGAMDRGELSRWKEWLVRTADHRTDAVADRSDPAPFVAKLLAELLTFARHPRSTFRQLTSGK